MESALRHKVLILMAAILSACLLWLAAKAEPARAIVPADCTIIGTEGHDNGVASPALVGTPGDDVICGLGGNDTIRGLGGNDTIRGDSGNDELVGGAGDDSLDGGSNVDAAHFTDATVGVTASLLTNQATGEGFDSMANIENLSGSNNNDSLTGNASANNLSGRSGNDQLLGLEGADRIVGGTQDDTLRGGLGDDTVIANGGFDDLLGEEGADTLDSREGVAANDALDGGSESDTCTTDATEEAIVSCEVVKALRVEAVAPTEGATGVAVGTDVTAIFSDEMNASTINGTTFILTKQGSTTSPIAAAVRYDFATKTATLNPDADLEGETAYTATVTTGAKDTAGNPLSEAKKWSFATAKGDATPPDPPTVDLAQASDTGTSNTDNITNDTTPTFSGSAEAGSTVELFDASTSLGTATADGSGAYSFTLAEGQALSDAEHRITAKATDSAGNQSAASAELLVRIDTQAPETAVDSGPSGTIGSSSATFEFSSSEAGSSFECKLDGASFEPCSSPRQYASLAEGSHAFEVGATDAAGNADGSPAKRTFTVDTQKPNAPTITSPANGSFDTDGNLSFLGEAEAGSTVELFEGAASQGTAEAGAEGSWSIELTNVTDGEHTYVAKATDAVGNQSVTSEAVSITVDTAAPDTSVESGPDGPTNDTTLTFTFGGTDNLTPTADLMYSYKLDGGEWSEYSSETSVTIAATGLGEGPHSLYARARDRAGFQDPSPAERSFEIDIRKPTVVAVAPADGAVKVPRTTDVTANFSEAMDASTINGTTFKLFKRNEDSTKIRVPATVTYDAATKSAVLDPTKDLARGATYIAKISTEAKDLADNEVSSSKIWKFTTAST